MSIKRQHVHNALFYSWAASVFLTLLGQFTGALPLIPRAPGIENTVEVTVGDHTVSVHGIVLSIILFVVGAYLCFAGGVHQKLTMFLVGFIVGANVAYIILSNARDDYGENTQTVLLVVSIVVGVLVGGLLTCCFFLAVYLLGALLGYLAALWLLSWSDGGLIESNWGRAILIVCFVVVGVVLMAFLERPMIVIATSFVGSFLIFFGVDLYVETGFTNAVITFLHARNTDVLVHSSSAVRGMLGGTLGLAVVASLFQWAVIHRRNTPPAWSQQYPMRQGWRPVR